MVNPASVATESSKVRREREEEDAGIETPSKKSRKAGKNKAAGVAGDVREQITEEKGGNGNNGTLGGNAERGPQGIADSTGGEGNPASVDPSAGLATTAEGTSRPDAPGEVVYRIPSYAGWFRWDKVHPLERRAMGEFFDKRSAAKTPRIYKEYRDFIINKYRENPKQALTFHEVRRMLIGDVNSVSRVFNFLEHWGLINQQFSLEPAVPGVGCPSPSVADAFPSGVNVVSAARTPGICTFESSGYAAGASLASNLATHRNAFSSTSKKAGSGSAGGNKAAGEGAHCQSCGKECWKQRFYRKQQPGCSLCSECVENGKLPAGSSASDFVQARGGEGAVGVKEWTSKETLLLLEAVSRFGENWNQVAGHVPTRSKAECVKHFIELPFGDDHSVEPEEARGGGAGDENAGAVRAGTEEAVSTDDAVASGGVACASSCVATGGAEGDGGGGAQELVSPFTDTSHPLFAQVTLLSGVVGPRVAAAAAQAAVAAIAEDEPGAWELPCMRRSKVVSGHKKHGLQSTQEHGGSVVEGRLDEVQCNGEGPSDGEQATSEKWRGGPPCQPDAAKAGAGGAELPSAVQARVSVATALGVAAANAKLLADQEEREIEHLVASIIDYQMKKLYSKLEHFEELGMLLEKERLEVEQARQQVYADRLRYAEAQAVSAKSLSRNPAPK